MKTKLLQLYQALLETAGLEVSDDGFVSLKAGDDRMPFNIGGKRLVLPIKEQLAVPNWENRAAFHPLNEHLVRGESEVLEKYRRALNLRLNHSISSVILSLLRLATSPAEHGKLSPDQTEFLSKVKAADDKTVEAFVSILKAVPASQFNKLLVSIYLKNPADIQKVKYRRGGIVSFPLYKHLLEAKTSREVHGVKVRVKDCDSLIALLEYLLPKLDAPLENYSRGSNSDIAPMLEALMAAFEAVAAPINRIVDLFEGIVDESFRLRTDWAEDMANLSSMQADIRLIPPLPGNEGAVAKAGSDTGAAKVEKATPTRTKANTTIEDLALAAAKAEVPRTSRETPPANAAAQPAPATSAPEQPARTGAVSFDDMMRAKYEAARQNNQYVDPRRYGLAPQALQQRQGYDPRYDPRYDRGQQPPYQGGGFPTRQPDRQLHWGGDRTGQVNWNNRGGRGGSGFGSL